MRTLAGRRGALPLLLAALGGSLACQDLGDVAGPGGGGSDDTTPPAVTVDDLPGSLTAGATVGLTVTDDRRLARAAVLLVADGQVLWTSPSVAVSGQSARPTFTLSGLPADVPLGTDLMLVGWARDAAGNERYSGAPDSAAADVAQAVGETIQLLLGGTVLLPEGAAASPVALDAERRIVYFLEPGAGAVGGVLLDEGRLAEWRIAVGSRPTHLEVPVRSDLPGRSLLVYSAGSRDIAVVRTTGVTGGSVQGRRDLPLVRLDLTRGDEAATGYLPGGAAAGMLTTCRTASDSCTTWLGSALQGEGGAGSTELVWQRFVASDPDGYNGFDLLTPQFTGVEGDEPLSVLARRRSTDQGIFFRSGVSNCGTLYDLDVAWGVRPDGQGSVYLSNPDCGLVRLDPTGAGGAQWTVSETAALQVAADERLGGGATAIAVAGDGSRVLVRTADALLVTESDLRVRGEFSGSDLGGFGFLTGVAAVGEGVWAAVGRGTSIEIHDVRRNVRLATLPVGMATAGRIWMMADSEREGGVLVVARAADGGALIVLRTTVDGVRAGTP